MKSWRTAMNAGQRSGPRQICESLQRPHQVGTLSSSIASPATVHGRARSRERSVNLRTLSLGSSIDTIVGPFFHHVCTQSRAMMPKLFGQLRALPFVGTKEHDGRRRTYTGSSIPGGRRSEPSPRTAKSALALFTLFLSMRFASSGE